ncbi:NAD(P)/FAD-dependent oxidoreductase [Allorhizobium taibaishanense]|uniref:FAD-dependent oxidoreductase n=1 Tax=Allorhizobium taibaishanense TaxID=887144 RepID=A0A1Q9A3I2_9HYPH|nr:FAD-binding oxidoreductase [Allorhizobium taibaishanense]MBB4006167.1 sarcosine oxidase [Allorhizobium taibaishanense]OLP49160.1 FAD-dependent oxidoreductase [Allorhizobium taibaishanense]
MADRVFKYLIIGRGMMGAAAARHLASQTDGVALLGPSEPEDKANHQGVFASHYDEARITRTIDPDPVWARLANRSIARYGEIERGSGIKFYHDVGCLIVGPKQGGANTYLAEVEQAVAALGMATEGLDHQALARRFPYFGFDAGSAGIFEGSSAGYVNPRALVAAQAVLGEKAGVTMIDATAVSVRDEGSHVAVTTDAGQVVKAEKLLVAAGGFSIAENLLPRKLDLSVNARTVAFFEIPDEELPTYKGMPSLIHHPENLQDHIYLLPPVRYPDRKTYLKIGGDPDDLKLTSEPDIRAWFRSGGRESTREHLHRIIRTLVPGVAQAAVSMAACVTSFTRNDYPAIGWSDSPRIGVLSGGCGQAAKSCDEIGRLGAVLLMRGSLDGEGYDVDFTPVFASDLA